MSVARHHVRAALITTAVAALAALSPASASAVTGCDRYASPTGSDGAAGSEASPFATAQKLGDSLVAGQTGCLRGGTYDPSSTYVFRPVRGGSSGAPITLRSYPGESARLVGIIYVPIGSNFITLSRLKIEGDGTQNSIQINASDVVVEDSDITNVRRGRSCMMLGDNSGYGPATRPTIRRNVFHDCGNPANGNQDHSIYASNAVDGQVVDNLLINQSGYSLHIYPNSRRMLYAHNVIDAGGDSIRGGAIFGSDSSYASNDNIVEKNVIAYAATYGIDAWWGGTTGTGNIARNNCMWANTLGNVVSAAGFTASASANTVTDPLFVNRTARDYRLGAASGCLSVVGYDTAALIASGGATPPPPSGDTTAPVASWSTPLTGGTVQGLLNEVSANCLVSASDDVAVTQVDFLLDGQPLNTEFYAPWSCSWDTTKTPDGQHTLAAKVSDAAGNTTTKTITVTVANAPVNAAPTVTLKTSADGTTFVRWITLTATATDDKAVSKVEFYVAGKLVYTDTASPYNVRWDSRKQIGSGSHTATAKAYDAQGLTATASVQVTKK